jgi:hypothetical protein
MRFQKPDQNQINILLGSGTPSGARHFQSGQDVASYLKQMDMSLTAAGTTLDLDLECLLILKRNSDWTL